MLWEHFNVLCRGEEIRRPEHNANLTCKHLHYGDPYLRLGPFKLEEMNHQPFIGVLHGFMYDHEADEFREKVSLISNFEPGCKHPSISQINKINFDVLRFCKAK